MIRLLPKIMMLASSAVLTSVPSATPADWYKEVSDNLSQGVCFGFVSEDIGASYEVDLYIPFTDSGLGLPFTIDSFQFSNGYWGLTNVWDYELVDPVTSISIVQGLSLVNYLVSSGAEDYVPIRCTMRTQDGDYSVPVVNGVSLCDYFVIDGTIDFPLEPDMGEEGIVTIPKVVGFDAVPVYSVDFGSEGSLDFLPLYQADYSESASDVFGVVNDAIGEMGSGLADGVEEATALFYADGSFTTLGILTLLTCGVALVFWAFYLIRKYLHVGVK